MAKEREGVFNFATSWNKRNRVVQHEASAGMKDFKTTDSDDRHSMNALILSLMAN